MQRSSSVAVVGAGVAVLALVAHLWMLGVHVAAEPSVTSQPSIAAATTTAPLPTPGCGMGMSACQVPMPVHLLTVTVVLTMAAAGLAGGRYHEPDGRGARSRPAARQRPPPNPSVAASVVLLV